MNAKKLTMFVALLVLVALPAAAFTVDGQISPSTEWDGVGLSATDPNEPDISDTGDIHYVYLACDATTIYLRLDTWATPVKWGSGTTNEGFQAYFDTDQNASTGCDDSVGHVGGDGYEVRIYIDLGNLPTPAFFTQQCSSGAWGPTLGGGVAAAGVNIFEVSAPLGAGTVLGDFCGDPLEFFVYFDDGTQGAEDEIPDSGNETLVELASFTARPFGHAVQVQWVTASEIDNAGFNLYRRTADEAGWAKLNGSLIPATGGPTWPAEYELIDDAVRAGVKYYYLLEDVDVFGTTAEHGPVWVTVPLQGEPVAAVD